MQTLEIKFEIQILGGGRGREEGPEVTLEICQARARQTLDFQHAQTATSSSNFVRVTKSQQDGLIFRFQLIDQIFYDLQVSGNQIRPRRDGLGYRATLDQ